MCAKTNTHSCKDKYTYGVTGSVRYSTPVLKVLTSFMIELDPLLLVVGSSNASRRQDQTRFQMKIEDVDRR